MTRLSDETRNRLKPISTATVATALYKRGFRNQCIQDVHPLGPDQPTLVGEAFTLRYMPAREDLNQLSVFRDRAHPQRKAVEDCPPGAVLVMDSRKDARAASAGAILVTRLMQRGVAGVITDGGFRDSVEIAKLRLPAYRRLAKDGGTLIRGADPIGLPARGCLLRVPFAFRGGLVLIAAKFAAIPRGRRTEPTQ